MEGKKLNLYAPLPSIRRISIRTEDLSESDNKKTMITRPAIRSCGSTKQETPVFVLPDQSFDHLTEAASIPFVWEKIPGKPKDDMATLIQESGLLETDEEDEDLDTLSSNMSFSVNCSTSGVSEINNNGEKSVCDDEKSRQSVDLMMSRFLPAAKAMAFTHQKHQSSSSYNSSEQKQITPYREALVIRQRSQLAAEHEHFAIVQSLYDDLNIDDGDDDDEDEDDDEVDEDGHGDNKICPNVTKKVWGFLPRLCAKNSFKFLNPVPLDSRSNPVSKHSGNQTGLPDWSTRRLSGFISPYRTSHSETGFLGTPESFKRLNRGISKSQELYPTRPNREILPNYSNSGEIRMYRNSVSTPLRAKRTIMPDSRFLVEEVNRRKSKSGILLKSSPDYTPEISPPPLPETPSRPWLRRNLLPPVNPRQYGVVLDQTGTKKPLNQEVLESTKWETIVKTSYVHNDHARYSQEMIVHSSRQHNT